MKIAFLLPSLANRGPIIFTQYLITGLLRKGIYIEIFYFNDTTCNKLDLGVKCTKISKIKKMSFSEFDIVHSTMAIPDIYASLFVNKKKWICSMHNLLIEDVKMSHSKLKSFLICNLWINSIKKCKNIIVSSNYMMEYYIKLLSTKINFIVIPYGIQEKEYSEIEKTDLEKINEFKRRNLKIIGSVGLLIERKGFSQLIKLLKDKENLALVLIGEGDERKNLEHLIAENHLETRVFMPGFRNNSHNYYQYFDVYAHVSYSEGFGLAMLEAMSKKIPIICSKLEIYNDYFTDEDVCFFTPGNEDELIIAYEKNCHDMSNYKNNSYNLYKKYFDINVMATKHVNLYNEIIFKNNELNK